ncbi:MAG: radical SAM protein [Methanobacteriota archaeon]|nr:MAG: radical SAM protein [Euryarchaeota archaeon]
MWTDADIGNQLDWYRHVSTNTMPAKFQIARRVMVPEFDGMSSEELWSVHAKATDEFLKLWKEVRLNGQSITALPEPTPSLMDLNVELVQRMARNCVFCRWRCGVDRSQPEGAKRGTCQLGLESRVGSYFHHRGEELIYRGTHGSGTIFFTSCNMRCVFCQNGSISKDRLNGLVVNPEDLAMIIRQLRIEGCHNINFVGGDPIVHLHTIIEAISKLRLHMADQLPDRLRSLQSDWWYGYRPSLKHADYQGMFNAPMLWNSNFFMSDEAMAILRTVMDVWLPDLKFYSKECARELSRTPWYFETVSKKIKQIYDWGESFSIRHLIMPNHVECCTKPILEWIASEVPNALVNIMDQYHPDSFTDPNSPEYNSRYVAISRFPTREEIKRAYEIADELGIIYEQITFERFYRNG